MRIGFLGKGGSGKTSVSAGFIRWLEMQGSKILAIDADLNSHLQESLDLHGEATPIGGKFDEIASYVRGDRVDLGSRPIVATTPPSEASRFIGVSHSDPLLSRYCIHRKNLTFLRVGTYEREDIGASCFHSKLHSLGLILSHLVDSEDEYVAVDATAGADTLAKELIVAYDLNLFIVEPTKKSTRVLQDFLHTDPASAAHTFVIGNKIKGNTDLSFLKSEIASVRMLGHIGFSSELGDFERGDKESFNIFVSKYEAVWKAIAHALKKHARPWGAYQKRLHEIHKKSCRLWHNRFYGVELDVDLDSPLVKTPIVPSSGTQESILAR